MAKLPGTTAPRPTPQPTRGLPNYSRLENAAYKAVEPAGAAAKAGAEAAGGIADALGRIQLREEGLARDADDASYAEQLNELLRGLEEGGDLSDSEVVDEAIKKADELMGDTVSSHKGNEASRKQLENRLRRRRIDFADTMAVKRIAASRSRQEETFTRRNQAITGQILSDPDVLLAEDIGAVFRKYDGTVQEELDFLGVVNPAIRRAYLSAGRENVAQSMLTTLIQKGDFERARDLLRNEAVAENIDSGVRRDMAVRISNAEQRLSQANAEAESMMAKARALAGPNATDEEVRNIARKMEGITEDPGNEVDKWVTVGGDVVGVSKTGAVITRLKGPTPEEEAERAAAVEEAKFGAKIDFMNDVLGQSGASPLPDETTASMDPNTIEDPVVRGEVTAMTQPFGEEPASPAFQDAMRMFMTARRLYAAGDPLKNAGGYIQQARFILENDPEIKRMEELNKPLTVDAAREFGVPVGSTMKDVLGRIPQSPGALAQEKGAGSARGRRQIEGEEQLAFIDEARMMIGDLLDEVEVDPGVVGVRGSLRATGQTAVGVLGDLGMDSLVETARNMAFEGTELGLDEAAALFESETLSVLDILENSIGMILARLRTPSGRIPVDVINRSISDVGIKGLKGSKQVENRLRFVLSQLDRRAEAINKRFNLTPQETTQPESGVPELIIKDGKLVPRE